MTSCHFITIFMEILLVFVEALMFKIARDKKSLITDNILQTEVLL